MISDEERTARIRAARAEADRLRADPTTPRTAFWLSFADDGFLGGCLIDDVVNIADAITKSHRLGINPGGEVAIAEVALDTCPVGFPRNRLLSKADLKELGGFYRMPT
jgi:hypothetical protein